MFFFFEFSCLGQLLSVAVIGKSYFRNICSGKSNVVKCMRSYKDKRTHYLMYPMEIANQFMSIGVKKNERCLYRWHVKPGDISVVYPVFRELGRDVTVVTLSSVDWTFSMTSSLNYP